MIEILVIQIAAGLVIVAAVAAPGLIAWRRREGRSENDSRWATPASVSAGGRPLKEPGRGDKTTPLTTAARARRSRLLRAPRSPLGLSPAPRLLHLARSLAAAALPLTRTLIGKPGRRFSKTCP